MTREFSVRVSRELARWVRRQGSPQEVIELLAVRAARGRLRAGAPDPGPGPERLTVRFPASGLSRLRSVTHSRKNLVAFRKLILAGYRAQALPPAPRTAPGGPAKAPAIVSARKAGDYALPPAWFQDTSSLAERLSSAGIYWPGEDRQRENMSQKRSHERPRRVLTYLIWAIVGLIFLALTSSSQKTSKSAGFGSGGTL